MAISFKFGNERTLPDDLTRTFLDVALGHRQAMFDECLLVHRSACRNHLTSAEVETQAPLGQRPGPGG